MTRFHLRQALSTVRGYPQVDFVNKSLSVQEARRRVALQSDCNYEPFHI